MAKVEAHIPYFDLSSCILLWVCPKKSPGPSQGTALLNVQMPVIIKNNDVKLGSSIGSVWEKYSVHVSMECGLGSEKSERKSDIGVKWKSPFSHKTLESRRSANIPLSNPVFNKSKPHPTD